MIEKRSLVQRRTQSNQSRIRRPLSPQPSICPHQSIDAAHRQHRALELVTKSSNPLFRPRSYRACTRHSATNTSRCQHISYSKQNTSPSSTLPFTKTYLRPQGAWWGPKLGHIYAFTEHETDQCHHHSAFLRAAGEPGELVRLRSRVVVKTPRKKSGQARRWQRLRHCVFRACSSGNWEEWASMRMPRITM